MAGQPRRDRPGSPRGTRCPPAWHPGRADNPERPERSAVARHRRAPEPAQFSRLLVGGRARRSPVGVVVLSVVVSHGRAALVPDALPLATGPRAPSWEAGQRAGSMNELSSRHFRNWLVAWSMVRLPHVIETSRTSSAARSPW